MFPCGLSLSPPVIGFVVWYFVSCLFGHRTLSGKVQCSMDAKDLIPQLRKGPSSNGRFLPPYNHWAKVLFPWLEVRKSARHSHSHYPLTQSWQMGDFMAFLRDVLGSWTAMGERLSSAKLLSKCSVALLAQVRETHRRDPLRSCRAHVPTLTLLRVEGIVPAESGGHNNCWAKARGRRPSGTHGAREQGLGTHEGDRKLQGDQSQVPVHTGCTP